MLEFETQRQFNATIRTMAPVGRYAIAAWALVVGKLIVTVAALGFMPNRLAATIEPSPKIGSVRVVSEPVQQSREVMTEPKSAPPHPPSAANNAELAKAKALEEMNKGAGAMESIEPQPVRSYRESPPPSAVHMARQTECSSNFR